MEHLTAEEATKFFSDFYGGEHHIPGYKVAPFGFGFSVLHNRGSLSSFDFSELTRLVIMAHDRCVRVEVGAEKKHELRIAIWKRQREGSIDARHPTIEKAICDFRGIPHYPCEHKYDDLGFDFEHGKVTCNRCHLELEAD
jgi:hypothetical protein